MGERDVLGIYIPRRISELSDQDILAEIQELQNRREAILAELSKEKKAKAGKPKKEKVQDLTKMDTDDALIVLATQMGITIAELKLIITGSK